MSDIVLVDRTRDEIWDSVFEEIYHVVDSGEFSLDTIVQKATEAAMVGLELVGLQFKKPGYPIRSGGLW